MLQGRDVGNCSDDSSIMADKQKKKTRGNYCVAGGPNMANCENNSLTPGISMHYFPKDETLRTKWIRFVQIHRKDFIPSKSATLCSVHFDETCFESKSVAFTSAETGKTIQPKRYLIKGSVPSRDTVVPNSSPLTTRKRRMVSKNFMGFLCCDISCMDIIVVSLACMQSASCTFFEIQMS